MESEFITQKLIKALKKYRYALLILAVGVVLMNLPTKKAADIPKESPVNTTEPAAESFNEELRTVLEKIQGVGKVEVLLTVGQGPVTYYQENRDETVTDGNTVLRTETVTLTDSSRNESGLVCKTESEVYRGAMVICEGADKASVRLSVIDAVSKVTGLSSDRISVLKMK